METITRSNAQNIILASLPDNEFTHILPHLTLVDMLWRKTIYEPNTPSRTAYFPLSGYFSVIAVNSANIRIETALVGREGFVGLPIILDAEQSPVEVLVQSKGRALSVDRDSMLESFEHCPVLKSLLLRYNHVVTVQNAQSALANGRFTITERLARWLLMSHDRADSNEIEMTHEFLSLMLAVRRSGVTEALHELEGMNVIRSTRGRVAILNRLGLETIAGSSYGTPESEYERLIAPLSRPR